MLRVTQCDQNRVVVCVHVSQARRPPEGLRARRRAGLRHRARRRRADCPVLRQAGRLVSLVAGGWEAMCSNTGV